ncbi:MAG: transposase [Gammaproteobacteria bacterium]
MNHGKELPKVVDKSQADIDAAIAAIKASEIESGTKDFAISCIKLAVWLPKALLEHKIKLSNLRRLLFGLGKRDKKKPKDGEQSDTTDNAKHNTDTTTPTNPESIEMETPVTTNEIAKPKPGHGRLPHSAYTNTIEHQLTTAEYKAGDPCPMHCSGKLYCIEPGIVVRVKGQNLAAVHKYWIDKLRCASCSYIISADVPNHVGTEKYDAAFKAILALQKYYVAVPFNRQAYFQSLLGVPLPASTQWQLIEEVGGAALLVFPTLERLAANGELVHNDDTPVKITDIIRHNRTNPIKKRTGMFTTGILSRTDQRDIALFYNGTMHAGENMEKLLKKRDAQAGEIIQMCDALSRNIPASFNTILCNCLSHGFRKFDELKEFYPEPCIRVIELIATVYRNEELTTRLIKQERLEYHQHYSTPIMNQLHEYLVHQLETKQVEPNDSLGKATRYMLKHWNELTQFLRIAGAPLDNNVLERALKSPIRGRRTWLFYKTEYGAMIGGVLTSVIYTCALAGINPLDYLIALQEHKSQIVKEPERWLPWCYQDTLATSLVA